LKRGSFTEAVRALRRAVELQPDNIDAAVKLGDMYLLAYSADPAKGQSLIPEIQELVDRLSRKNPNSFEALRLQGHIALANKDVPVAIDRFRAANKLKPLQQDVVVVLFQALVANKQNEEAEKLARDMISSAKQFGPMYDLLYFMFLRENRLDDAEKIMKLKAENNPNVSQFQIQLAGHYLGTKRRPEMEAVLQRLTSNPKEHPDAFVLVGDFFFRIREWERAAQNYQEGIKQFPKDKGSYQKRMVELLAAQGRGKEAMTVVDQVLKDNPKDNDAIAMHAALALQTGDRQQIQAAISDLQSLVSKTPTNHLLRFNLARALAAKGDLDQARVQLEEAVRLRSDFVGAKELLARIYLLRRDPGKALKEADDILKLDKTVLSARLIRSSALLALGEREKARQELDEVLKNSPQSTEAKFQLGYLSFSERKYKESEDIFRALHKANPSDFRGLIGVVETNVAQNRFKEAIDDLQSELQKDSKRNDIRLALANVYVRGEQYDPALKIYSELLAPNPKNADLLFKMAETYRRKGDLNQAAEYFRKASSASPNDTLALLQLGLLMDGTGKREQAKPIYEQILRLEPDNPVALNNLAFIKAEEGQDLDSALTMAQRARQKLPTDRSIADTLGWIYIKKNLSDDAVRVFIDLVQKEPANPTYRYHYGLALLQKGDKLSARKEFESALANNPSRDEMSKIKDVLARI
ncbi:MAG: tetratricopeptide repeat protein, partial [Bryobacteraceae bacterium]